MLGKIKELILDSFAFFIFSALIMTPMEYIGGEYAREVTAIFMESLAPRSIMGLFVVSTMSAAVIMFFFGKHCVDKRVNNFLYEHVVFKVTKFGMSFAAASAGMLAGLAVAATINSEYKVTAAVLFTTFKCSWGQTRMALS